MSIVQICCQNAVAICAEYDEELHVFSRILDIPNERLVPFGARDGSGHVTRSRLTSWWQGRAIPVTRDGYEALRADLDGLDTLDLLDRTMGLSLSDQYWMRPEDATSSWEDVNFFDNAFDGALGLLTLGSLSSFTRASLDASPHNPNSSLGGNLKKAWELHNGTRYLVKAGSAPFEQEPANEVIATTLYKRLLQPDDYVPYSLEMREGRPFSVCPNMVSRDECLVPAQDIINARKRHGNQSPWQHLLASYEELGLQDVEEQLTKMFVCDFMLANHDRHWNNLGVIFDARNMEAKRIAPIFDSGSSLWNDAFELEVPADYWYRPLPLIRERARRIRPEEQLELMRSFGWMDLTALDGFADEVREGLSFGTRLQPERIEAVARGVEQNIERVRRAARA